MSDHTTLHIILTYRSTFTKCQCRLHVRQAVMKTYKELSCKLSETLTTHFNRARHTHICYTHIHMSRNIILRHTQTNLWSSWVHGHSTKHATRHILEAQCAFKVLMIPKSCNSHYVSHFAAFFIVVGA
jgi:hypothetical protein